MKKKKNTVRILLSNINSLGVKAGGYKEEELLKTIFNYKVDIVGITEPNVHWGKVSAQDHFYERTSGWFENQRTSLAYNINRGRRRSTRAQRGGTITLARDDISHRCFSHGRDDSGLGRWSWLRFRGKQQSITRVVTAYCPQRSTGPDTVYSQQLEYLGRNPIKAFWDDIGAQVDEWHSSGDRVILMGDWNTDVQKEKFKDWMAFHGLDNGLTRLHGPNSPATYNGGTSTIDAILCSSDFDPAQGGYLDFGFVPGDHRGLWLDISLDEFIGYKPPPIVKASARRLKTDDPAVVSRYNQLLDSYLEEHNLYDRLYRLLKTSPDGEFTHSQKMEFEKIDKLSSQGMIFAERRCRKLKMGGVKWSPELQHARDIITLWLLVIRKHRGRKVGARRIVRMRKRLKVDSTNVSLTTAQARLDEAFVIYKAAKANAETLSIAYRERLAQRKADAGKLTQATQLRQLNTIERQRTTARRVKNTLGKGKGQGTSKIQVEVDGEIVDVTHKEEMESYIIPENEAKFHQTSHTPLLHDDIIIDLGLMGDGPRIDEVLDGTYEPPESASWATRRWLRHMKVDTTAHREEIMTSLADFRKGWKLVKERTSSGIQHFGHFKAGCTHKKIGWFLFVRSVLPYGRGYSPSRWQHGTDVMLLKKEELYLLTKLRTIVLYEADYNHENKRLGRDTMTMGISQGRLAKEQFCRPGRGARENAICKRLAFDYTRLKKKPFAFGASDLASCYDRIVHNAASIALQKIGISRRKIKSMFGTIQSLTHRVRTLFGDSTKTFGGDPRKYFRPPQGTGQGNGAAPSIWSILSSTIFEILHEEGYSTPFIFGISLGLFRMCGFSYVDDCDLLMTGDCPDVVAEDFQHMLNVWDELMEVTGAALAPSKCWWYLVDFEWKNGIWRMTDPCEDFDLTARDKQGNRVALTRMKSNQAMEMVGVHLAPDGSQTKQTEVLKKKATKWAKCISDGHLPYHETWTAMTTSAIKSIEYPLCAATLSQQELTSVMTPILHSGLPRSGMVRSFPRAVLYGPIELQGVGVSDPYISQYCGHIRTIVGQIWKGSETGDFTRANIEAAALEAGIPGPLFEYNHEITWFNTTNSLIIQTHNFCREHGITFDDGCGFLKTKRKNDVLLMDFLRAKGYTRGELRRINRCRLYYGVNSLSDITNASGTHLQDAFFSQTHFQKSNSFDWPRQGRPSSIDRKEWMTAIQLCFTTGNGVLTTPLGPWDVDDSEYSRDWEWFTDNDDNLYFHSGPTWYELEHRNPRRRTRTKHSTFVKDFSTFIKVPFPPQDLYRTTVTNTTRGDLQHDGRSDKIQQLQQSCYPSREGLFQCMNDHPDSSWIFQTVEIYVEFSCLINAIYQGKSMAISDGSFFPRLKKGGMAWCFCDDQGVVLAEGGGLIPGSPKTQGAYRSECGGLHGICGFLECLEKASPPTAKYKICLGCDGESALYKCIEEPREKVSTSQKHVDIITRIQDTRYSLSAEIRSHHVRGHQDQLGRSLTLAEQMNVRMDKMAKQMVVYCVANSIPSLLTLPPSKSGIRHVSVKGVCLGSELDKTLPNEVTGNRLRKWWCNRTDPSRNRFDRRVGHLIDWKVVGRVMKNSPHSKRKFISKWVCDQAAVGTTMGIRQGRFLNRCPRCNFHKEDRLHILRCKKKISGDKWSSLITELDRWMMAKDTNHDLRENLILLLHQWYRDISVTIPRDCPDDIRYVFQSQAKIGWDNFFDGLLSKDWSQCQQHWYDSRDSMRTGEKWAVGFSAEVWKVVFGMWEHRNACLHKTKTNDELEGIFAIKQASIREVELGLTPGMDPIFEVYLDVPAEVLCKYSSLRLRNWLCIVRRARESTGFLYDDILRTNKALRDWTGLPPLV